MVNASIAAWLIACAIALFPQAAPASAPHGNVPQLQASDEELASFFDRFIAERAYDLWIPGAALVVVRDGRTILQRGHGEAHSGSGQPVDPGRTLFRAASISKLLPWILVMQLVEEGRLDLDADLNEYLDFRIPETFGTPITMRHLMTHTAGFPERFHGVFDPQLGTPLGEVLVRNLPERVAPAGSTVAYSNYGAALAGYVVQRLHGRPWEQLVRERIFQPLGMTRSTVAQPVPPDLEPSLASTYRFGDPRPGPFRVTPLAPMGSLTATPADMGRLLALFLDRGVAGGGRVLDAATVEAMLRLQRPLGPGLPDGLGLGFLVGEYRGVRHAGHAGNMSTLATDLELLPDHGLGWYYVFNSQGPNEAARQVREQLLHAVIDRFLAEDAAPAVARGPSTAAEVAGDYLSTRRLRSGPLMFSGLVNTTSVAEDGKGGLTIESSGRTTQWVPQGEDRFREVRSGIPLAATRDADGRVVRIASAALYPVAEFERAPLLAGVVPPLALFSGASFLLAAIAAPLLWWIRRRRARLAVDSAAHGGEAGPPALLAWSRRAGWLIGATIGAWACFGLALAVDFELLFTIPWPIRRGLGVLSLLTAPLALLMVAGAVTRWRDPAAGLASRLSVSVLALAAVAIAFLLHALDVTNGSTDW